LDPHLTHSTFADRAQPARRAVFASVSAIAKRGLLQDANTVGQQSIVSRLYGRLIE
jgi:hypothetical protein